MPSDKSQNLQDVFLNHVRKVKMPVTIFLVNGVKLQGVITWFDNFCVLLRRDNHSQLVYKHAIDNDYGGIILANDFADLRHLSGAEQGCRADARYRDD